MDLVQKSPLELPFYCEFRLWSYSTHVALEFAYLKTELIFTSKTVAKDQKGFIEDLYAMQYMSSTSADCSKNKAFEC